jgi:hypothetical protein
VTAHEAAAAGATLVIRILEKKFVAFALMIAFAVIASTELGQEALPPETGSNG